MCRRRSRDPQAHWWLSLLVAAGLFLCLPARAVNVVVKLKNGDQLSGRLIAQETNQVIIATTWAETIVLPLSVIGGLRTAEGDVLYAPPPPAPPPAPALAAAKPMPMPPAARMKNLTTTANLGMDLLLGAKDRQIYYTRI